MRQYRAGSRIGRSRTGLWGLQPNAVVPFTASDDFGGVYPNSGSVGDANWDLRYVQTGSNGTSSISGEVLTLAMTAAAGFIRETISLSSSHTGGFKWTLNYTTDVDANNEQAAIGVYVGGNYYSIRRNRLAGQAQVQTKKDAGIDSTTNCLDSEYLTGAFIIELIDTTMTAKIDGTTFKTWTGVTDGLTALEFDVSNNGTVITMDISSHELLDGAGDPVLIEV